MGLQKLKKNTVPWPQRKSRNTLWFFCEAYAEGLRSEFADSLKDLMAAQPPLEQTLTGQVLGATKGYKDEKQA